MQNQFIRDFVICGIVNVLVFILPFMLLMNCFGISMELSLGISWLISTTVTAWAIGGDDDDD